MTASAISSGGSALPQPLETDSSISPRIEEGRQYRAAMEGMEGLTVAGDAGTAQTEAGEPRTSASASALDDSTAHQKSNEPTIRRNDKLPSFTQPASPLHPPSSSVVPSTMPTSTSSRSLQIPDSPIFPTVSSKTLSQRRPSLTPSLDGFASQSTPPRTHRISPGAKNYFPLVSTPSTKRRPSLEPAAPTDSSELRATSPALAPPIPSTSGADRHSIFPVISKPTTRPTPSNIFPLVKSPSSSLSQSTNSTSSKMSANPYPFADPPYSPPPQQRRPSLTTSTTSSKSDSTTTSARPRQPSSTYSGSTNKSPRSVGRAPSITSTTYSPTSRSTYAPSITPSSIAPSAEGPTSIFANPVGYKPRTLTGLLLPKPSTQRSPSPTSPSSNSKPKSKFSFFSSSKDKSGKDREGVTAPAHLVAGPPRSNSNRVLDAALTTSQTWAARRGEQMMAPSSPMVGTFAYRPGHQIRREMEAAQNGGGGAFEAEELKRRLEREEDKAVFTSGGGNGSVFPTVKREG